MTTEKKYSGQFVDFYCGYRLAPGLPGPLSPADTGPIPGIRADAAPICPACTRGDRAGVHRDAVPCNMPRSSSSDCPTPRALGLALQTMFRVVGQPAGQPVVKKARASDDKCTSCNRLAPFDWVQYRPCLCGHCTACSLLANHGDCVGHGRCPLCRNVTDNYRVFSDAAVGTAIVPTGIDRAAVAELAAEGVVADLTNSAPDANPLAIYLDGEWVGVGAGNYPHLLPHVIVRVL